VETVIYKPRQGEGKSARFNPEGGSRNKELITLAGQIGNIGNAERQKLARQLHDRVGQDLTLLGFKLHYLRTQLSERTAIFKLINESISLVEQISECVRGLMDELSPDGSGD
jgi:signal transduction histidine kinase